jgi:hypothetical protein
MDEGRRQIDMAQESFGVGVAQEIWGLSTKSRNAPKFPFS